MAVRILWGILVSAAAVFALGRSDSTTSMAAGRPDSSGAAVVSKRLDGAMATIPAGCFLMGRVTGGSGSSGGDGLHKVCVSGFRMDRTEVTQGAYRKLMGTNPSQNAACGDSCPVELVSWDEARKFCRLAGKRLPTEAEWEYAARGGDSTEFHWGQDSGEAGKHAWYRGNSGDKTHPVALKEPSRWGLYDMAGNVVEWVSDWMGDAYPVKAQKDPKGPRTGFNKALRGGWFGKAAEDLMPTLRGGSSPDERFGFLGFRCVEP